jgi:hypothetical protein
MREHGFLLSSEPAKRELRGSRCFKKGSARHAPKGAAAGAVFLRPLAGPGRSGYWCAAPFIWRTADAPSSRPPGSTIPEGDELHGIISFPTARRPGCVVRRAEDPPMSELGSIDSDRYKLVRGLVNTMYDGLVGQVIADIKALPDSCRQSGDDSKLRNVWEEFKYQVQREEFVMFDAYAQTIQDICTKRLHAVERDRQQLLWLWTDEYLDVWTDQDEVSLDDWVAEDITAELYRRVEHVAVNEDLEVDPDEERDRERYEEDMAPYRERDEEDGAQ